MKFFLSLNFLKLSYIIILQYFISTIKIDFSYYHKSRQIDQNITNLISSCIGEIKEVQVSDIFPNIQEDNKKRLSLLKYYDITSRSNNTNTNKSNIFILAGEHPRELIASELAYNFINFLCTGKDKTILNRDPNYLLNNFNFRIIVNSNPNGRELVENGEYCKRTNLNNVDVNRNWNIFWSRGTSTTEENPGHQPFSEIETQFTYMAIKDFNAKLFLSIHSGVYGLYLPYAYLEEEGKYNRENMLEVLTEIQKKFCTLCQVGPPSKLIGYKSSGTCLDYIYDNFKVPYSIAWEIYSNEHELPEFQNYFAKKNKNNLKKPVYPSNQVKPSESNSNKLNSVNSSFLLIKEKDKFVESTKNSLFNKLRKAQDDYQRYYTEEEIQMCLNLFNPQGRDAYQFFIINWSRAILHLLEYIKNH